MADFDPAPLKDLLDPAARRAGVDSGVLAGRVWQVWRGVVGPEVARHAEPTSLRAGVLRVRADSASWSTELTYLAEEIRARLNSAVGQELVREVRVWSGPGRVLVPRVNEPGVSPGPAPHSSGGDPVTAFGRARRAWLRRRRGVS
jgi:predicted nucleic acid-binding Zn ribbon protein